MKRPSEHSNGTVAVERTLEEAGFAPKTATLLATANRWLFVFTILVSGAALVWIGTDLWPDLDAERWQVWADANPGFFAPLDEGATLAIVPSLHSHMGLTITKVGAGVQVERHIWFPFEDVPVGLVMEPEAADRVLLLRFDADNFWDEWQTVVEDLGIHVYEHLTRRSPHAAGYRAFLQQLRAPELPAGGDAATAAGV